MHQNWFIIDRWGRRSANCRADSYWNRLSSGALDIHWSAFNQLVTRARPDEVVQALRSVAAMFEIDLVDVTAQPDRWDGAILVQQNGACLSVSEPGVDLDERLLRPESADAVSGLLAADGAFYGYDPATSTVQLTVYEQGAPSLEWVDSDLPGPSFARTFHRNGRATDEDPRAYALRAMQLPAASSLLDRVHFVEMSLERFGLEIVAASLPDAATRVALRIGEG